MMNHKEIYDRIDKANELTRQFLKEKYGFLWKFKLEKHEYPIKFYEIFGELNSHTTIKEDKS